MTTDDVEPDALGVSCKKLRMALRDLKVRLRAQYRAALSRGEWSDSKGHQGSRDCGVEHTVSALVPAGSG